MIFHTDHPLYNYHSHTQFCDGRNTLEEIAASAAEEGFRYWGITPHSPINIDSPCNMLREQVPEYLERCNDVKGKYNGRMNVFTGMEVDYLGADFGPHIDYFQNLPLDYRIGSVHFVPTQEGVLLDCDGSVERFSQYLKDGYNGDLRYVVEKYFEQVLYMIERGGFELLGHFDKIIGNASALDTEMENADWYEALIDDVISHAKAARLTVEINTKAYGDRHRFYPHERWWDKLLAAGLPLVVNSDTHYRDKANLNRPLCLDLLATHNS